MLSSALLAERTDRLPPVRRITVSLPDELWERAGAEAQGAGQSLSSYARDALIARLERRLRAQDVDMLYDLQRRVRQLESEVGQWRTR